MKHLDAENVRVLILSAGKIDNELEKIFGKIPSGLIPINGKPVIFRIIDKLLDDGIKKISITVGYKKEILEKIVKGKLNKRLNEITLLGQEYIKDSDLSVAELLKKSNANVNLFVRYEVGDGIEHEEKNFAEEVKAQVDASD